MSLRTYKTLISFYSTIFILCVLHFLPLFGGYTLLTESSDSTTKEFPSYVLQLDSLHFMSSLLVTIGATFPLFLDYLIDVLQFGFKYANQINSYEYYIPRKEIFIGLLIPNFVFLLYILPHKKYDLVPCIAGIRDTFFICCFLFYMNKIDSVRWTSRSSASIAILFTTSNVIVVYNVFQNNMTLSYIVLIFIIVGLLLLVNLYYHWFTYYYSLQDNTLLQDIAICNTFACFFLFFLFIDWIPKILLSPTSTWSANGVNYLTMYSYLSAVCTLAVTVITIRMAKQNRVDADLQKTYRHFTNEILTPLKVVVLGLDLLRQELERKHGKKYSDSLREIRFSCDAAVNTLNEMLLCDKIEHNEMTLELEPLEPIPFVKDILNPLQIQARESGVELKLELDIDDRQEQQLESYEMSADASKLSQVLRNLISNAIKFTPRGGQVTVELTPKSRSARGRAGVGVRQMAFSDNIVQNFYDILRVRVIDTGVGLSKENQVILMKRFGHFSLGKLQNDGGTGLGLYICKRIMELHNGSLSVYSEGVNRGSIFTIIIPLQRYSNERNHMRGQHTTTPVLPFDVMNTLDEEGDSEADNLDPPQSPIHPSKSAVVHPTALYPTTTSAKFLDSVLVVDDSALNRKMMCRLLTSKCKVCHEADDGEAAVNQARTALLHGRPFDAILMDFQMPVMDGPEATRRIREIGYEGLIIGVTGNTLPVDIEFFMKAGATIVLSKPLSVERLDNVLLTFTK